LRITHNDTKISNALFDKDNKGLCVIDTDTVMVGIIHYDFGDAIRTICNTAFEDEKDLKKVNFNLEYYKAFTKGFMEAIHMQLSLLDVQHFALAAKTITFIMGLRMLTDFLNNDVYYKTSYDLHNLDRTKNQFKLVDSMSENFEEMNKISLAEYKKSFQK
jgi:thiamine kinase-like enzyme